MTRPTSLTLVVTAHRTRHLRQAMASVGRQTTQDFDLVCCADAANDEPVAELFGRLAPAIQCRSTRIVEVNGGTAGRVRNAGFAASSTGWISYLDGDDVLDDNAVARVLVAIGAGDADILSTGMARIDQRGRQSVLTESLAYLPPRWIYHIDPEAVGHATYFNQFLAIKTELWEDYPFYEETNGEDIDFMLHQLLNGRFRKVPEPLYGYRDTPGSFSKQQFSGGDLCTRRYQSGYYQALFAERYRDDLSSNFADELETT